MKPADPERLRRVNALLEAALALTPDEREAWLGALGEVDRPLLPTLRALLARAVSDDDEFMHRPPVLGPEALEAGETDIAGDRIGPYRLVRELGAGGMATVWLAERVDGAMQRQVALKLPRMGGALGLARRMARERDILATLEHPHIAHLYDAGVTDAGRPWLAMESVTGVPIDVHCREHALDVPARLRLFLQVAEAVAHAHARLVVHRDLKPSNILVSADGSVKLLDFGVAKLLEDDTAPPAPDLTQQIGRAVTPDYASPEQVLGKPVTVATDVYSLGVVLYELLAGQRPYRIGRVGAAALEEAILSAAVPPASSVVDDRRRARELRGDLDNVLAKALRKDAARRYPSVESMAADVQRYLAGEPVLAERRSGWYRVGKFIRRNRMTFGAASAAAFALVVGTGVAMWQAREAARERDVAQALLARNEAVNEFLTMMLTDGVRPHQAEVVRQMLERGERLADAAFGRVPEHHAAILRLLADYWNDPERSDPLLARAGQVLSGSQDRALRALVDCGRGPTLEALGHHGEAARLLERWIAEPGTPEIAVIECMKLRAGGALGQSDAAGALRWSERALRRLRALPRPSAVHEAELIGDVAYALSLTGRTTEAMQRFDEAQMRFAAAGREESSVARVVLSNRAGAELSSGDPRAALTRYDALLAMHARLLPGQPAPSWVLGNRALALDKLGRYAEALDAYEATSLASLQMTNVAGRVFGLVGMAGVRVQLGEPAEAARLLAEARAEAQGKVPPGHPGLLRAAIVQSQLDVAAGRAAAAVARLGEALERMRGAGGSAPALAVLQRHRAEALLAAGQLDAAHADAQAAVVVFDRLRGDRLHSCDLAVAWLTLARVQFARGEVRARETARHAVESLRATVDAKSPELQQAADFADKLAR